MLKLRTYHDSPHENIFWNEKHFTNLLSLQQLTTENILILNHSFKLNMMIILHFSRQSENEKN
ncbi:MAG: hypothetical protein EAZ97_08850 [Bacteroidetes bacterium]|nr:MAG: hypothetical protein EAZ97_08850 [Bacteroidota bacterium]